MKKMKLNVQVVSGFFLIPLMENALLQQHGFKDALNMTQMENVPIVMNIILKAVIHASLLLLVLREEHMLNLVMFVKLVLLMMKMDGALVMMELKILRVILRLELKLILLCWCLFWQFLFRKTFY